MTVAYGKRLTISRKDNMTVVNQESYFEGRQVKDVEMYTETIKTDDLNKALAEFLTLIDKYKAGKITDFGISCITYPNGSISHVEKMWTTA